MATSRATWLRELARFQVVRAEQLREKSHQWFDEAGFLHKHQRWAPMIYLGGFVLECLLKSALWPRRYDAAAAELIRRSHDLHRLIARLPQVDALLRRPQFDRVRASFDLVASWTVRIRYNPKRPSSADAIDYWRRLAEVRQWLLGRI